MTNLLSQIRYNEFVIINSLQRNYDKLTMKV